VTDLESEKEIVTVARNISLFGCFVATVTPFLTGTKVSRSPRRNGRAIAAKLGVGLGTLYRVVPGRPKTREKVFGTRS
jgi:hypothetical protein